jgi:DNA modification methylase
MSKKTAAPWRSRIVGTGEEPPDQLVANPRNWRTHPGNQRDALRGSLDTVGWVQQVMVNRTTGHVVDGHARVEEAISRDEPTVPVLYVELTEAEEALVLATLDPIGAMAESDSTRLTALLAEVGEHDAGLDDLLASLASEVPFVGLTDPDAVPELADDSGIVAGDVFLLGGHRLMCGDSTKAEDVARLMDGASDDIMLTDPPYGVSYAEIVDGRGNQKDGGWRPIANDGLRGGDLELLMRDAFSHTDAKTAFVWFGHEARFETERAIESAGFTVSQEIVWVKNALVMSRGADYHWRHEQAVFAKRKGHRAPPTRDQNTVWEVDKPTGSTHPTQKPVELYTKPLQNHTAPGDRLYDPFSGSGTAIIAAEQTGRRCYAMEIDPRYVAVAMKRWEEFTGRKAEKVPDGTTDEAQP